MDLIIFMDEPSTDKSPVRRHPVIMRTENIRFAGSIFAKLLIVLGITAWIASASPVGPWRKHPGICKHLACTWDWIVFI